MKLKFGFFFIFLIIIINTAKCQFADTVLLHTINISEIRSLLFSKGNHHLQIDSSTIASSPGNNLAEVLSTGTSIFIKAYSPGGSATISARGTEARHNAVLWNGFNLNSPSLGLCDLSLIPTFISDQITLIEGGSGPVNGNAALGSTVVLENDLPSFKKNTNIGLNLETGCFGNFHGSIKFKTGNKFIESKTVLFYERAENNFEFVNSTIRDQPTVKEQNASFKNYGLLQNLDFKINPSNFLNIAIWYQTYFRELPPLMTSTSSAAIQRDSLLRLSGGYKLLLKKSVLKIKAAYFKEYQFYNDTKLNSHYEYLTNSVLSELEYRVFISNKITLNSGLTYINSEAAFDEYKTSQKRVSTSFFAEILYEPIEQWKFNLNFRKEFTNVENPPFIPSFGFEGVIIKNTLNAFGNIGRHYNLPSMNDLFWRPGGNENLLPEDAWGEEIGISSAAGKNQLPVISFALFNSNVKNWIKWQPGAGGFYSPDNLREVHISGFETNVSYTHKIKIVNFNLALHYTFVNSAISKSYTAFETVTVGKQLIYVPQNIFNGIFNIHWNGYSLNYNQTFTGKRFTTSDNSSSLDPYQVSNSTLEKVITFNTFNFRLNFKVMNLFNTSYQVIAYRPMPGRWYSVGLKFDLKIKSQHKN